MSESFPGFLHRRRVVVRAEGLHDVRFGTVGHSIEYVHVESALNAEHRRQEANGTGSRHENARRRPSSPSPNPLDVLPCLGDNARRLEQNPRKPQRGRHLDEVLRLDAVALRRKPMTFFDPAFGVSAIAAHVPLVDRAIRTRDRIGPSDDSDDAISALEVASGRRVDDLAQRLVSQDESLTSRGRPAVGAPDDFEIRSAYADGQRFDQHRAVRPRRFRDLVESCGASLVGNHRDRSHRGTSDHRPSTRRRGTTSHSRRSGSPRGPSIWQVSR